MCPGKPGSDGCSSVEQGKVRLWVNPDREEFHCWHCGFGGKSLAAIMVQGSSEQREYLGARDDGRCRHVEVLLPPCNSLPDGFKPFKLDGSFEEAPFLTYLHSRKVTDHTVALYRMGYITSGPLGGRVVIPSFNSNGYINFWSARSIYPGDHLFRYRIPTASKDVISNEHMVDWRSGVYLVEGIFDELAIGPQAISLYGKILPSKLALKLVQERPPVTYVCLDSDAKAQSRSLLNRLVGYGLPSAIVNLRDKDPSCAGAASVTEAVGQARVVTDRVSLTKAQFEGLVG